MACHLSLASPLPPAQLFIDSMTDSCGLSLLGETQLRLLSSSADVLPADLLGKTVSVDVELPEGGKRHFHGHVTRFGISPHQGRYYGYQATVRPWLWFLTRTADCRIFQHLSVPDIVKQVFADHAGLARYEFKLFRSYRPWVYCVQYRETDYNFIARLLEHEGIYWYFEHSAEGHKLILVDSLTAHDPAPFCESLPYYDGSAQVTPGTEYVVNWACSSGVKTGRATVTSYDFERPSTDLIATTAQSQELELDKYEFFDFQGDYVQLPDGTQYNDDRLTEMQTRFVAARGASNAQGIEVGRLLELTQHPREDQNLKYLVTALQTEARSSSHDTGTSTESGSYQCSFNAIPASQQFRPPRITPKPFVQGPQTAVVVGPPGEEIHTDPYGRVKVQFHWDRYGQKNDKSSCWVRVSHPWAGKNFGGIHIPRIGQEVVVDFLEGDPDQPLITGRVYNAEQMPPWELPANATQSGILTRSSKTGEYENANAIRFEDMKGAEQLWIHAEKNQDNEVENDETTWVGRDRTETVDRNETVTVGNNHVETVKQNKTETVGDTQTVDVGRTYLISVGDFFAITVGEAQLTMNKNGMVTITGTRFLFDSSGPVEINGKDIHLNP